MLSFTTTVNNESGIHARPAKELASEAKKYVSDIRIQAHNKDVNAKSVIYLMSLGACKGDEVTVTFDGDDEKIAYDSIKLLFANNLNEN